MSQSTVNHGYHRSRTVVQKYGGSSLATLEQVRQVADSVHERRRGGIHTVVVVSAGGDTTDELLAATATLGGTAHHRDTDQLLATGENASAALLALALNGRGVPAISLTGPQARIAVAGRHGSGVVSSIDASAVRRSLAEGRVVVVAGFHGENDRGDVVTLGRGGSDTTAVALATALGARCEIYSDVPGVCTADPRVVPEARILSAVGAGLMAEMAFAGARVLHSRAVELAAMHRVDVLVAQTYPRTTGTTILGGSEQLMLEDDGVITAVTHDLDVARVLVQADAIAERSDPTSTVLNALAERSVPVDLVARSGPHEHEFRMGFTVRESDLDDVRAALSAVTIGAGSSIRVDNQVGKLSLVGVGLLNRPRYAARMLGILSSAGIPTSWVSTSQLRTSAVVPRAQTLAAVRLLHHEFGLAEDAPGDADSDVVVGLPSGAAVNAKNAPSSV